MPPSLTESTPLVPKQQKPVQQEEEKMSLKFSSVAAAFQLLLIILFGTITRYGDQALPPHLRKDAVGGPDNVSADAHPGNNHISVYYSSMRLCNTPRQENLEIIIYNIKEHKPLHSKDENWPDSDPSK
ncbi:unnamed protein product [Porites evermanni]|uniref:Uncharacterized protein n=1 Tax=Porites evermanni TaxID=104178 RepID=A0ABN8R525_9CNID|nr:unnamed protein product [Porites evermanni]